MQVNNIVQEMIAYDYCASRIYQYHPTPDRSVDVLSETGSLVSGSSGLCSRGEFCGSDQSDSTLGAERVSDTISRSDGSALCKCAYYTHWKRRYSAENKICIGKRASS